ncbi:hypothetical protein HDU91_006604 [Kappamyces sp. JEL0680]|nr:hypothetical protein HDU91_006604 [Kappamyces sp. JEL0680]
METSTALFNAQSILTIRTTAFALNSIVFLVSAPLVAHYRRMNPIRFRTWSLTLLGSASLWLASGLDALYHLLGEKYSALLYSPYILWILSLGSLIPILIRHYFLLRASKLQQLISQGGVGANALIFDVIKLKAWTSESRTWLVFGATFAAPLVVVLACISILPPEGFFFVINMILFVQSSFLVVFTGWYLVRSPMDNLGIKIQFLSAVALIFFYTMTVLVCYITKTNWIGAQLLASLIPCMVFVILVAWPVAVCIKMSREDRARPRSQILYHQQLGQPFVRTSQRRLSETPLDSILSNPVLVEAFSKFLEREYCVENLLFLQEMQKYRSASESSDYSYSQVLNMRNELVAGFVAPSSPNQVNLPGTIVKPILEMARSPYDAKSSILLFEAEQHVRQLVSENHLSRFFREIHDQLGIEVV